MKSLLPLLLTLLLQAVGTALAALLHLEGLRVEPAIAVLAFTAVRLDPLAGLLGASAIGLGTDLMAGAPAGLHMLAFTLVFLLGRGLSELLGVRHGVAALPVALVLSAAARLLLAALLALFGDSGARLADLDGQLAGVALDAALAVPLWYLLEALYRSLAPDLHASWGTRP